MAGWPEFATDSGTGRWQEAEAEVRRQSVPTGGDCRQDCRQ